MVNLPHALTRMQELEIVTGASVVTFLLTCAIEFTFRVGRRLGYDL